MRNPLLPDVADLIVAKALNKGVEERYQDAGDLARDLRECRNTLLGLASGPVQRDRRQPRPAAGARHHARAATSWRP